MTFFEPVAAALAEASAERCFPVAPLAGAKPASRAPEPRRTLLKSLESQIIGPWRREVIRKLFNKNTPDATGTKEVAAITPQGLKATVNVNRGTSLQLGETVKTERWSKLLLARPGGTESVLQFENLGPELQAAFQSNHLFLVATDGANFGTFASKVKIGKWEFDLDPSKSESNVIIFKFGPGKLRERLLDPRSWTNPSDFNDTEDGALAELITQISEYIEDVDAIFDDDNENETEEEREEREKKKPDPGGCGVRSIRRIIRACEVLF